MRILYLIDEMQAVTAGGTERQLLQMARLLQQSGAEVYIATLRGTAWLTSEIAGCHVEHFCFGSLWHVPSLGELRRLRHWMREKKIQVLQTFFVESNILGPVLGHFACVPVILGSRRNLNYWMKPTTAFLQRTANGYSTRLVANCQAVREYVAATEGISTANIDVIYNGLDVARFAPDPDVRRSARMQYGFADTDIVVGSVSVLRPIKGCETFIDAAAIVLRESPHARFVMVGDGPIRQELESRASELGARFLFVGAQLDIRPFLNMFDIAVLSSESEGFSNSVLEYMAAGLPAVVTNVGGNPEAIANAGLVVDPRDPSQLAAAILRLLRSPQERAEFSRRALQRAADFSLDSTRKTLTAYYRRLLHPSPVSDAVPT